MKFGPEPAAEAVGAILAHSMISSHGRYAKGTQLTAEHVADLADAGHETLVVARLEPGDVEENAAAEQLATAIASDPETSGVRVTAAGAGRVNLYATSPGIVRMDVTAISAMNAIDPMITLATVPQYHRVDAGTMVGTIKIIAYAVSEGALAQACAAVSAAICVNEPVFKTATLIETQVGDVIPSGKGRAAMAGRLDRLGLTLSERVIVSHQTGAISQAIADAPGDVVFVLTASATSDLCDVAPSALRQSGGSVVAYGMPVDPGNLLFFGWLSERPVIGLPGCARSPALNGADWVLERIICGVDLSQADIAAMGVGGLLKEIPTRPRPRAV